MRAPGAAACQLAARRSEAGGTRTALSERKQATRPCAQKNRSRDYAEALASCRGRAQAPGLARKGCRAPLGRTGAPGQSPRMAGQEAIRPDTLRRMAMGKVFQDNVRCFCCWVYILPPFRFARAAELLLTPAAATPPQAEAINSISFSSDGEWLVSSSDDESINLYSCMKGRCAAAAPRCSFGLLCWPRLSRAARVAASKRRSTAKSTAST